MRQLFSENKDYADFVKYSGAVLFTDQDLTEYQELFMPYADDLAIKRDITVGINEITLRNRLFKTHAKSVATALEK